eukprot:gene5286-biopygen12600
MATKGNGHIGQWSHGPIPQECSRIFVRSPQVDTLYPRNPVDAPFPQIRDGHQAGSGRVISGRWGPPRGGWRRSDGKGCTTSTQVLVQCSVGNGCPEQSPPLWRGSAALGTAAWWVRGWQRRSGAQCGRLHHAPDARTSTRQWKTGPLGHPRGAPRRSGELEAQLDGGARHRRGGLPDAAHPRPVDVRQQLPDARQQRRVPRREGAAGDGRQAQPCRITPVEVEVEAPVLVRVAREAAQLHHRPAPARPVGARRAALGDARYMRKGAHKQSNRRKFLSRWVSAVCSAPGTSRKLYLGNSHGNCIRIISNIKNSSFAGPAWILISCTPAPLAIGREIAAQRSRALGTVQPQAAAATKYAILGSSTARGWGKWTG